ncbi:MAG: methionine synthase [Myxococcota bacterium]
MKTLSLERQRRDAALRDALQNQILVLDGAMGTALQNRELTADDFGGPELEGCNEQLVITRPDVVLDIHREYLAAGADVVETNTFGGTPLVLAEYGLEAQAEEINRRAAELAREACEAFSAEHPRFVAGSMGPTTRSITVTGGVTFEELVQNFYLQARGLIAGGADYLLLETAQDTRNLKAGLLGIDQLRQELAYDIPVAVSGTIEPMGTMLAGQGVEALYASLMNWQLLYLGLNCATGPEFMTDHIRSLSQLARFPISCVPNAGLPDERGCYLETPAMIARTLERFMAAGWLNVVGGCCGTTHAHIEAISRVARQHRPRRALQVPRSLVSGIDFLEITDDNRPILVGERTNVLGSRNFKKLIAEGQYELASEIARKQVRGGAHIIDVGLADPDRNEKHDVDQFLRHVIQKVKVPLMIDSTDSAVIEHALKYCQGKAIINSINLEDGEERYEQVVPLALKYGAALVVGCIDEDPVQGMAVSRERKLEVAARSRQILMEQFDFPETDIIFDPLVFPCATGAAEYVGSAVETIEGIRLIKAAFPLCRTVLGISNVSFGLPAAGREVLNSVFLYHCTRAGLDMAIVNTEKLERYASIPEEERRLADELLYNRGEDPVAAYAAHFKGARVRTQATSTLPLDQRLARYIIEGVKDGLVQDLELKRQEARPLEIINGPLMAGMEEVGRLFNNNELIVAEVLQSAEAMKAAVSHLEQFMEKDASSSRGKMLLATVKGDVHDIGKNLVDIIFSNNGYQVINLGIKIAPEALISAYREHQPDLLGLSGLLVKSAQQMVVTAQDLRTAGIQVPMMVGGAALTRKFAETQIAPAYDNLVVYARDAMNGLELANKLMQPAGKQALQAELSARQADWQVPGAGTAERAEDLKPTRSDVRQDLPQLLPPDLERHVIRNISAPEIWRFLNHNMLYAKHLGLKGNLEKHMAERDARFLELREVIEEVQQHWLRHGHQIDVLYQFFQAEAEGDSLHIFDAAGTKRESFLFPRQGRAPHLCLSDYVLPPQAGQRDHVAFFVTTAGAGIRAQADVWKAQGHYLKCHVLQALALETAEAAAEWLHKRLRSAWGAPDPLELSLDALHKGHYQGKRYSFGYPACPELADQARLWRLLRPDEMGVQLTDGYMMEPEASVSALVFSHPEARYFSI